MTELRQFVARNRLAAVGAAILALTLLAVALAPLLAPSPIAVDVANRLAVPGGAHLLGTDPLGRDVFSRVLHGGRATLLIGVTVVAAAFAVGVMAGTVAGFVGSVADALIMRLADALLAFPGLVLAIALAAALGPGLGNAMIAVAVTLAPQFARLARAQALAVSARPFVEAAVAAGTPPTMILVRHVLPNGIGALLVQASLAVGSAILQTAALGFLGLGAQPPSPEWGADVAAGLPLVRDAPWVALAPGGAILLAALSFNLLGDALADWFDPRRRMAA